MKVNISIGSEFKRQFKQLAKKYKSLTDDYCTFTKDLENNPFQGTDLGNGVRKLRMAITSKGKGKSGGARVITLNILVKQQPEDVIDITLLTIYDKSEIQNVTDQFIKSLISNL